MRVERPGGQTSPLISFDIGISVIQTGGGAYLIKDVLT